MWSLSRTGPLASFLFLSYTFFLGGRSLLQMGTQVTAPCLEMGNSLRARFRVVVFTEAVLTLPELNRATEK